MCNNDAMLSGSLHVLSPKAKLEGCVNFSNNTPQLGESPQSSDEIISSPRSPDYPPRVSVSPHSPDTTFSMSMMSAVANSTVIMDTAKYNEEGTDNVATCTGKVTEYPFCSLPEKMDDAQIDFPQVEPASKQQDATGEMDKESKSGLIGIKTELEETQEIFQTVKSEWVEDGSSTIALSRADTTTSQEKHVASVTNASSSSQSKTCSSSRKKRSKEHESERRRCSRCHRRKSIKRASIGVQCKRDRHVLSSLSGKPMSLSFSKSTNENLRLNLQMKNYKMLNNPVVKSELLEGLKYKKFIHIETYPNGGATVVHMYQDEIDSLSREQMEELAQEYFKVTEYYNKVKKLEKSYMAYNCRSFNFV